MRLKVISLLQPWASLVVMGAKKIETRSWTTHHRGTLLIHASTGKAGSFFCTSTPFSNFIPDFKQLPFGAIIGEVTLTSILRIEDIEMTDSEINRLTLEEKAFGDYSGGRWGWMFEDPKAYERPIPARGHLRLWEIEIDS
jgi:hypothetical protein